MNDWVDEAYKNAIERLEQMVSTYEVLTQMPIPMAEEMFKMIEKAPIEDQIRYIALVKRGVPALQSAQELFKELTDVFIELLKKIEEVV